jgi:hypothetical protein
MRCIVLCALLLAACGDNSKPQVRDDAGTGAPPDAASGRVIGCLDTPLVPAAPAGQLPCDLVPPRLQP